MGEQTELTPVVQLFRNENRRSILSWTIGEAPTGEWLSQQAFRDGSGVPKGGYTTRQFSTLVASGVLDIRGDDGARCQRPLTPEDRPPFPHYRVAETAVVDLLKDYPDYDTLLSVFDSKGSCRLVDFFLVGSNPDESYSYSAIERESGIGYYACDNNIDSLTDVGLVETDTRTGTTKYSLNTDSELTAFLAELNTAAAEAHDRRTSRTDASPGPEA